MDINTTRDAEEAIQLEENEKAIEKAEARLASKKADLKIYIEDTSYEIMISIAEEIIKLYKKRCKLLASLSPL